MTDTETDQWHRDQVIEAHGHVKGYNNALVQVEKVLNEQGESGLRLWLETMIDR